MTLKVEFNAKLSPLYPKSALHSSNSESFRKNSFVHNKLWEMERNNFWIAKQEKSDLWKKAEGRKFMNGDWGFSEDAQFIKFFKSLFK